MHGPVQMDMLCLGDCEMNGLEEAAMSAGTARIAGHAHRAEYDKYNRGNAGRLRHRR